MTLPAIAPQYPDISPALASKIESALSLTDKVAYDNVTHDDHGASILDAFGKPVKGLDARGGPFGAMLALSYDGDVFEPVGAPRGNNVIGSGIASYHAEDQAMGPDNIRLLVLRLQQLQQAGKNPFVWMLSSAQSCTTCHTKQEILARTLVAQELLKPRHFVTAYGATFDDTLHTAQFYDAQYADAMAHFVARPDSANNLVRYHSLPFHKAPEDMKSALRVCNRPVAMVMRNDTFYSFGFDQRTPFNPFDTAEKMAIVNACKRYKDEGAKYPWTVDGALYTTGPVGPLCFAEMGWTRINDIYAIELPAELQGKIAPTQEAPDIDNASFLKLVASGYHNPQAAIRVLRDASYRNTAQPKWAEMLAVNGEQLYNGPAVKPEVEAFRSTHTRHRFAALDLRDNLKITLPPVPLARLGHTPQRGPR